MCNEACIRFAEGHLRAEEIRGKEVLEVGSLIVNGSVRGVVSSFSPARYVGVDIAPGPGVDEICAVQDLVRRYGRNRYDVVVCTELLEHVKDWRSAISNLKNVLKEGGLLIITTRSRGFFYHGYPQDFWRYEADDLRTIFTDFRIESLMPDPSCPGVFMKARKKSPFFESLLDSHRLYSILKGKQCREIHAFEVFLFKPIRLMRVTVPRFIPSHLRAIIKKAVSGRALN